MELSLEFWYIFPIAILVATVAIAVGIGSPVFFSPLFMIILKFEPMVAVGTALLTQLFGLSSGFIAYAKARLIDYRLGLSLLIFSLPFAFLGAALGKYVPADLIRLVFSVGIVLIASQLFKSWRQDKEEQKQEGVQGNSFHYQVTNKRHGQVLAALGGLFLGMISVGLAELQSYYLIAKCKLPVAVAVATIIFILATTVFLASLGHLYQFLFHTSPETFGKVLNVTIFSVPGVIIGGQLGPRLQGYLPKQNIKIGIAILFALVGIFMLFTLLL